MNRHLRKFVANNSFWFGIGGAVFALLNIVAVIFIKIGVLRIEFGIFSCIILPNFIAKLIISVWLYYYTFNTSYGKDIRELAKMMIGVMAVNILFVAFDETTVTYYLIQGVANLALAIFSSIVISRCRYATRDKRYATMGFVTSMFMYLIIAFNVALIFISFSNYDPYLVTFVGVSHILAAIGCVFVKVMENNVKRAVDGE